MSESRWVRFDLYSLLILLDVSVKASSEDTLKMSKKGGDGDLGSEGSVLKENGVLTEQGKEEEVEMDKEKKVVEVEMEREKEVEVEKGIDPWSYSHGRLPCWWWLTALTLGPILLILRLVALAGLLLLWFAAHIVL